MKDYKPFDGNQSVTIGDLTIDNSEDKVVIYGDIDITRDKKGLENLNNLLELLEATKKQLEQEVLSENVKTKDSVIVKNPFKK